MTNYQLTKIYKIESNLGDKIYVGSTAKQYLSQRMQQHKNTYKHWKAGKNTSKLTSYELFDEYGPENCQIVLIEEYPCTCKDAKNAREGYFIKELNCVNKNIAGRTIKEYQQSEEGKKKLRKQKKNINRLQNLRKLLKLINNLKRVKKQLKLINNLKRVEKL